METTAKPLIYQVADAQQQKETFGFFKQNLPKIIFAILGLIILIEVVIGVKTLFLASRPKIAKIQPLGIGRIVLDSPKSAYKVGEVIPVDVRIVTAGKSSDSTDLILHYDPTILSAATDSIRVGSAYKNYPVADVDSQAGLVRVSGITPPGEEGFSGIGKLAAVDFKALKAGNTQVTIEFTNGSTTDSNIVESSVPRDILGEVTNLDLAVGNGTISNSPASAKSCSGYLQYCQDSTGRSGSQFCSSGAEKDGICQFDPKLTLQCGTCKI